MTVSHLCDHITKNFKEEECSRQAPLTLWLRYPNLNLHMLYHTNWASFIANYVVNYNHNICGGRGKYLLCHRSLEHSLYAKPFHIYIFDVTFESCNFHIITQITFMQHFYSIMISRGIGILDFKIVIRERGRECAVLIIFFSLLLLLLLLLWNRWKCSFISSTHVHTWKVSCRCEHIFLW